LQGSAHDAQKLIKETRSRSLERRDWKCSDEVTISKFEGDMLWVLKRNNSGVKQVNMNKRGGLGSTEKDKNNEEGNKGKNLSQ
jgi:hypothetical protein